MKMNRNTSKFARIAFAIRFILILCAFGDVKSSMLNELNNVIHTTVLNEDQIQDNADLMKKNIPMYDVLNDGNEYPNDMEYRRSDELSTEDYLELLLKDLTSNDKVGTGNDVLDEDDLMLDYEMTENTVEYEKRRIEEIKIQNLDDVIKNVSDALIETTKKQSNQTGTLSSLTFIFDSTGSMWDDLMGLKEGAKKILETMLARDEPPVANYILVPFRDPEIGPVTVTTNDTVLLEAIDNIEIYGGGDCPEVSLGAIQMALNYSLPYSYLYVFSDASASDYEIANELLNVVQRKKSQIVFILTGDCKDIDKPSYQVYEKLAAASSGQVFHLNKTDVSEVLKFVDDSLEKNRVNLGTIVNPSGYDNKHNISVDDTIKKVTVSVAGGAPQVSVTNPSGEKIEGPPKVVSTLDLLQIKVVNIINPEPGKWTITVGSTDKHTVKLSAISEVKFNYGFFVNSTKNLDGTTNRPLQGVDNSLLIEIKEGGDKIDRLDNVEILDMDGKLHFEIPLEKVDDPDSPPYSYKTKGFLPPDEFFNIAINGIDKEGNNLRRAGSSAIQPQLPEQPYIEVENEIVVPIHNNVTIKCNVESLVPGYGWWFKNKKPVQKKQYFFQSRIIEYTIDDVNESNEGTYVCRTSNSAGVNKALTNIVISAPPPKVTMSPQNITLRPGIEVTITCIVDSELMLINEEMYFYKNDDDKNEIDKKKILDPKNHSKNGTITTFSFDVVTSQETEGFYGCSAMSRMGNATGLTHLKVLPHLKVSASPAIIEFQAGDDVDLVCSIKGSKYGMWNNSDHQIGLDTDLNKDVVENLSSNGEEMRLYLYIKGASREDKGFYTCTSYRDDDEEEREIVSARTELRFVEKPEFYDMPKVMKIRIGDNATINCNARGVPEPSRVWILPNGNQIDESNLENDRFNLVDKRNLIIHHFDIEDQGVYKCKVENQFGISETSLNIVGWSELIFAEKLSNKTINLHESVSFECPVDGTPTPTISWYHNDELIDTNNSTLSIESVLLKHEGKYTCIAKNEYENIRDESYLHVSGEPPKIILSPQNSTFRPNLTVFIECMVESVLPVKTVNMYLIPRYGDDAEKKILLPTTKVTSYMLSTFTHRIVTVKESEGEYICEADNIGGTTTESIFIDVLPTLEVTVHPKFLEYQENDSISFTCEIRGSYLGIWDIPNFNENFDINYEETSIEKASMDAKVNLKIDIKNSSKLNEGTYTCSGFRGDADDKELEKGISEAIFVEKPKINEMEKGILIEIGKMALINCNATGIPTPSIEWILPNGDKIAKNDTEVQRITINEDNQLFIQNMTAADEGTYRCKAVNKIGIGENTTNVSAWQKPYFKESLKNETVDIYRTINLTCHIDGIPYPDISWYQNDNELAKSNIFENGTILTINNADLDDGGVYTCFGENEYGAINGDVHLQITGLDPPVIVKGNASYVVKEGDTIEIVCRASQGKPTPVISWIKDGLKILSLSDENMGDSNIQNLKINESSIVIENVLSEHEGNYSCIGTNAAGIDKYEFHLEVQSPPRFSSFYSNEDNNKDQPLEAKAGHQIAFRCETMGKPKPLITWSKDGSPVQYTNSIYTDKNNSLVLSKTKETDAGVYTCFAQNPIGNMEKNFTLIVLVKPVISNEIADPVLQTIEGQMVVLPCPVHAIPPPEIRWLINENVIEPSDNKQVDKDNTLRFIANLTDIGVYQCEAINKVGNASQEYLVLIFMPPYIYPEDAEVVKITPGSPATLDCHAIGFPEPRIQWIKSGKHLEANTTDIIFNDSGHLEITNVTRNNSGAYICNAENNAGFSQKVFYVIVNEPPTILPSDVSKNVQILSGREEFRIPCHANGNPIPYISWLRNGKIIVNDLHSRVHPDGTLTLKYLTESLNGVYTCRATNSEGSFDVDYNVQIIAPLKLTEEEGYEKVVTAMEGSTAILDCPLKPTLTLPNIEWYKKSSLIENINETRLTLVNVTRDDATDYSCLASNAMGSVSAFFKLNIHWPPTLINSKNNDHEHIYLLEGDPLKLICNVNANPAADIQWMRDSEIVAEMSPVLKKKYIKSHHAGEHICIASNPLGQITKKFTVHVSALPKIDGPEYSNIEVLQSSAISLECNTYGIPKPEITWSVESSSDWIIVGDGRFLKSYNISRQSEGVYYCEATNSVGSASKQFNVTVLEPPRIEGVQMFTDDDNVTNVTSNILVKENSKARFACLSRGNPIPNVMWTKNGRIVSDNESVSSNGSELLFSNLKIKDSGIYSCMVTNKVGTEEHDISIEVLVSPQFEDDDKINANEKNKKIVKVLENQFVMLNCKVNGNPPPDIYWFKDKKYMAFYDSTMMTKEHGQYLLIKKVSKDHSGNYTCVARNSIGETKMHFQIDVLFSPFNDHHNGNLSTIAKKGEEVYFECPINGNPKPIVRWLKNPYFEITQGKYANLKIDNDEATLIINNVTVSDSGNYSCILTNKVGMTEITYSVEVVEPPSIGSDVNKQQAVTDDGTILVKIRRSFQLKCNATGYPEPNITWYKDGLPINTNRDSFFMSSDGHFINIMDALLTDTGKYTCNAENRAGFVSKDFWVKVLVPAEWGPWSQWSACSTSCGLGITKRLRKCQFYGDLETINIYNNRVERDTSVADKSSNDDSLDDTSNDITIEKPSRSERVWLSNDLLDKSACHGNISEIKPCFIAPCKIDGGWGDWSNWTTCSVKCGVGSKKRYRICNNPTPRYGGEPCDGVDNQQLQCNGTECSSWLPWSTWSACSTTCGKGVKTRYRKCNGTSDACLGDASEKMQCFLKDCFAPIDGGWSPWSDWSACSVTCGEGQQKRSRKCNSPIPKWGGKPCRSRNLQMRRCPNSVPCKEEGYASANLYNKKNLINNPKKVHLSVRGMINGHALLPRSAEGELNEFNGQQYVKASLDDLVAGKGDYLSHVTFLLSPEELGRSQTVENLTKRKAFDAPDNNNNRDTQIEFATGEKIKLYQRRKTVSDSGEVNYEIIVDGSIPKRSDQDDSDLNTFGHKRNDSNYKTYAPIDSLNNKVCPIGFTFDIKKMECNDINECENENKCHMTQMCENIPGSYRCFCEDGYRSLGLGQRCLDINECLQNSHGCSHECTNNPGSYYCSCPVPYKLDVDSKTCINDTTYANASAHIIIDVNKNIKDKTPIGSDEENVLLARISPKRTQEELFRLKQTGRQRYNYNSEEYEYDENEESDETSSSIDVDYGDYIGKVIQSRLSGQVSEFRRSNKRRPNEFNQKKKPLRTRLVAENLIKSNKTKPIAQIHINNTEVITSNNPKVVDRYSERIAKQINSPILEDNKKEGVMNNVPQLKNKGDKINTSNDKDEDDDDDCPPGYFFNHDKCDDVDECETKANNCNEEENVCINTQGSFMCIPTPCPSSYRRTSDRICIQWCNTTEKLCSERATVKQILEYITISTSQRETIMPGPIKSLDGGWLNKTRYFLESQPNNGKFQLKSDANVGILYTNNIPPLNTLHRITILSKTFEKSGNKLLYFRKYIIFVYILE